MGLNTCLFTGLGHDLRGPLRAVVRASGKGRAAEGGLWWGVFSWHWTQGAGLTAAEVVRSWGADDQALAVSTAEVEAAGSDAFMPGLVELILIPGAVNLATSALYDQIQRVIRHSRPDHRELELVEVTTVQGDRVVVVRLPLERS